MCVRKTNTCITVTATQHDYLLLVEKLRIQVCVCVNLKLKSFSNIFRTQDLEYTAEWSE